MEKDIGFNRNIKLDWLDAAAAFCLESDDADDLRKRLRPIIAEEIKSTPNIRKTIAILLNIWLMSDNDIPELRETARHLFFATVSTSDRVWLHYGLTMIVYPFFREAVTAIGQLSKYEETITTAAVRGKLFAELGELGSIKEAAGRVVFSLRDWSILADAEERNEYIPEYRNFIASSLDIELWMLACALNAHPVDQIPFADLLHLPALFPFKFTVTIHDLRQANWFEVQRQGLGLDMVRVV